ncbi:MAG: hypothetical protein ACM3ZE_31180 [Myxococcales bacterium]
MAANTFRSLTAVTTALVALACGSKPQRPTLPPPEFEPPVLTVWDAGLPQPTPVLESEPLMPGTAAAPEDAVPVPVPESTGEAPTSMRLAPES